MNTTAEFTTLPPGYWDIIPHHHENAVWVFGASSHVVNGPFDLGLIRGERLSIMVGEGQTALLTCRGQMHRAYFEGTHHIPIRSCPDNPEDGLLYILQTEQPLVVPWRQHLPLRPGSNPASTPGLTSGVFQAAIIDPCAFHASFLANHTGEGDTICRQTLAHLLPSFLAIHLARSGGDLHDFEQLATAIDRFPLRNLDSDLAPYGLSCLNVTLCEENGTTSLPVG